MINFIFYNYNSKIDIQKSKLRIQSSIPLQHPVSLYLCTALKISVYHNKAQLAFFLDTENKPVENTG